MISVEGLSVEFNATPLFEDVSYVINKKDRIALVGKNGAGKSTMLKILAGLQSPTHGIVATPKDVTIGYLPQVMILSDNRTVMGEAELAFEHIFELQAKLERMNQELADERPFCKAGGFCRIAAQHWQVFAPAPRVSERTKVYRKHRKSNSAKAEAILCLRNMRYFRCFELHR